MSANRARGGGVKALSDAFAKNASYLFRVPLDILIFSLKKRRCGWLLSLQQLILIFIYIFPFMIINLKLGFSWITNMRNWVFMLKFLWFIYSLTWNPCFTWILILYFSRKLGCGQSTVEHFNFPFMQYF